MEKIGAFIQYHRLASGFKSQRRLSNRSGISPATISRIESGSQKPNPETLGILAPYLTTTSFVELMYRAGFLDLNLDIEDLKEVQLTLDEQDVTESELNAVVTFLRMLRKQSDKY